ncbi:MAG: hypothetical protein SWH61_05110 [Thermodesulfobacteriota bacterium]|nr:hypothetical protein [Thermodesulfobacteriota bacterium]
MKFSIPYNCDTQLLTELLQQNLIESVEDIYFAANPEILPSGRRPKIKNYIKFNGDEVHFDSENYDQDIDQLFHFCHKHRIKINLLLNFSSILTVEQLKYVQQMIDMGVKIVTVGNMELLKQIKDSITSDIQIQNSVYFKLNHRKEIFNAISNGIAIFLFPPNKNHKLQYINALAGILRSHKIQLKLMVNEGCLIQCNHRYNCQKDSQKYSIESAINDYLNNVEKHRVLDHPCREYLNQYGIEQTNFIHPHEIKNYKHIDFTYKIVGRSFSTENILCSMKAYKSGSYKGDLRRIIENFKHSVKPLYTSYSKTYFLTKENDKSDC